MEGFTVIGVIGETLKELLRQNLEASFGSEFTKAGDAVTLITPKEMGTSNRLSLFLYHIVENPFMKNQPMERLSPGRLKYPPLSLNLHYLLTPNIIKETETFKVSDGHTILGRSMQALYDFAILEGTVLRDLMVETNPDYGDFFEYIREIRIVLNSLSLDDLTKLWNSLDTSLMSSAAYEVRVAFVESDREKEFKRILQKDADYFQGEGP